MEVSRSREAEALREAVIVFEAGTGPRMLTLRSFRTDKHVEEANEDDGGYKQQTNRQGKPWADGSITGGCQFREKLPAGVWVKC